MMVTKEFTCLLSHGELAALLSTTSAASPAAMASSSKSSAIMSRNSTIRCISRALPLFLARISGHSERCLKRATSFGCVSCRRSANSRCPKMGSGLCNSSLVLVRSAASSDEALPWARHSQTRPSHASSPDNEILPDDRTWPGALRRRPGLGPAHGPANWSPSSWPPPSRSLRIWSRDASSGPACCVGLALWLRSISALCSRSCSSRAASRRAASRRSKAAFRRSRICSMIADLMS